MCLKPWTLPADEDQRKRGPPNINLTVRIGTDFDLRVEWSRIKVKLDENLQTSPLKAWFAYKDVQEVVTAINTMAAGVHAGLNTRGTCVEFQHIINNVHQSLCKNGDAQALSPEQMHIAVRLMNMPSWQYEQL